MCVVLISVTLFLILRQRALKTPAQAPECDVAQTAAVPVGIAADAGAPPPVVADPIDIGGAVPVAQVQVGDKYILRM